MSMGKRYFIYTSPTPVAQPPYGTPGWPGICHAFHLGSTGSATVFTNFLIVTEDSHFDEGVPLPQGWTALPHYLLGQTLPAAVVTMLQQDFPNITSTDTTLRAMIKVALTAHPIFAPVR